MAHIKKSFKENYQGTYLKLPWVSELLKRRPEMNDGTNNPPFSKLEFSFQAHDSFSVIGELSRAEWFIV